MKNTGFSLGAYAKFIKRMSRFTPAWCYYRYNIVCMCMLIIVMHDDVGRWLSLLVVLLGWANPGTCM